MRKIFLVLLIGSLCVVSSELMAQEKAQGANTNFEPARPATAQPSSSPSDQPSSVDSKATSEKDSSIPASEVEKVSRDEVRRRQEAQMMAQQLIESGLKLYYNGQYEEAIVQLEQAIKVLPRAKATEVDYNRAIHGLTESYSHLADVALHANDAAKAKQFAEKALEYDVRNRTAANILAKANESLKTGKEIFVKKPIPADNSPEFLAKREEIKKLFREGRILLNSGQFDEAEAKFKQVLLIDRYNDDAYQLMDQVNKARIEFGENAADKSRTKRLWEVVEGWVPRVGSDVKLPSNESRGAISGASVSQAKIKKKLEEIMFPEISFREAVISDVISFLSEESRKLDPEHVGVNIVLGGVLSAPQVAQAPAMPPESGPTPVTPLPPTGNTNETVRPITLNLRNVPMIDALSYITTLADLKYRIEKSAVLILPMNAPEPDMPTQTYPLYAGAFGDYIDPIGFSSGGSALTSTVAQAGTQFAQSQSAGRTAGGGGSQGFLALGTSRSATLFTRRTGEIQGFFTQAGVSWPTNSTLVYHEATSSIIVRNTPENLARIEQILSTINAPPPQVTIEAKFVDISQSDLDELGFQWGIGGKNLGSFGVNGGGALSPFGFPGGTAPAANNLSSGLRQASSIQQNAIDSLLTANGFGSAATPQGQVATLSGILTDPQFSLVINALSQKTSTDLLSAPKITVISGRAAEIRVAQEFIYPTAFTAPTAQTAAGSAGSASVGVTPSIPSSFSTREVGVLLNVLPTVGADGYTINLALIPEVTEFLGFIEYGGNEALSAGNTIVNVFNSIKQPLFSTRALATSVVIFDGQTVVLGGLIREDVSVLSDKIPFLGDIPILGRLFQSKVNSRTKRNLLMFVTARIIDPAGNPVHRRETAATSLPN